MISARPGWHDTTSGRFLFLKKIFHITVNVFIISVDNNIEYLNMIIVIQIIKMDFGGVP